FFVTSEEVVLRGCVVALWASLAPPVAAAALSEALQAALALAPGERAAAGAAARAWVGEHADVGAETATMAALIEELAARRARAGGG
ncbi:MAG: hypothetical protein ACR2H2_14630, partial [Solirubrobacteraceae bacterium]